MNPTQPARWKVDRFEPRSTPPRHRSRILLVLQRRWCCTSATVATTTTTKTTARQLLAKDQCPRTKQCHCHPFPLSSHATNRAEPWFTGLHATSIPLHACWHRRYARAATEPRNRGVAASPTIDRVTTWSLSLRDPSSSSECSSSCREGTQDKGEKLRIDREGRDKRVIYVQVGGTLGTYARRWRNMHDYYSLLSPGTVFHL